VEKWHASSNWLSDLLVCTWKGITCNEYNHVEQLDLNDNGLKEAEKVFDAIQLLTSLPTLKVSSRFQNDSEIVTPASPYSLCRFKSNYVQDINLDGNDITIDLRSIEKVSPLEALSISSTRLKTLEGIGQANKLKRLVAKNNGLTDIPKELFALTMLKQLDLSSNKLNGPVQSVLFGMQHLRELILTDNYLSGTISEINEGSALEKLALGHQKGSKIGGRLPDFAKATKLR